jgi:serine/threonine-protein kinase
MTSHETSPPAVAPGETLADKYRVLRIIGSGGMGVVVAARRLEDGRLVAIKMLHTSLVEDAETVSRFAREGRAAAKIESAHVAEVLEVGELPDRTPYIVMEHLEGSDLARVVRERTTIPPRQAVDWVLEACEAIAEAHAHGIVHRDIKPSNLFLAKDAGGEEQVKVLDFGISKMALEAGGLATTKTSSVLGSPLYMSPEQLRSAKVVDARSDIWSIGVVLYELCAGAPPFEATTIAELGAAVLKGEAPWLGDVAPEVPSGLASVVATCLEREPRRRFANLADFATAAAEHGSEGARASAERIVATLGMPGERAVLSERKLASAPPHPLAETLPYKPRADTTPPLSRSYSETAPLRSRAWIGAVAIAVALGGLALAQMMRTPANAAPATAATAPPPPSPHDTRDTPAAPPPETHPAPTASALATAPAAPTVAPTAPAAPRTTPATTAARPREPAREPTPPVAIVPHVEPAITAPRPDPVKPPPAVDPNGIARSSKD